MLRSLRVHGFAFTDELELVLEPGLNVVTGERGASRAVLLQALDLALGGRSDGDLVRPGADEGAVEVVFSAVPAPVRDALGIAGIAVTDELTLRRVIARSGPPRAFVNGTPASSPLLREIAQHLLRAYGQDQYQALGRAESHRDLLDAVGGLGTSLDEMRLRYARLVAARYALKEGRNEQEAAAQRNARARAEAAELGQAALVSGEEETLTAERGRLLHVERLTALVTAAQADLDSNDGTAAKILGRVLARLREAERLDVGIGGTRGLVEGALTEVEEAGSSLGRYLRALVPDPQRLEAVEARLAGLASLRTKYGTTIDALIIRGQELAAELARDPSAANILALEAGVEAARRTAAEWAGRLSVERRRVARDLARALAGELPGLALEGARFTVRFGEVEGRPVGPEGWDEVEFFLSMVPGEELRPLAGVVSGAALSRIMLALKSLEAGEGGATLVFDEVEAGIGGPVAEVVARKLRQVGRARQVLCITQLPVIAAYAEHHIAVVERVREGRTVASARQLAPTERVAELARMLGGASLSRELRDHAEQLLRQAGPRGGPA